MQLWTVLSLVVIGGSAWGHQLTPTYPMLEPSYISGVLKADMKMFNNRKDVNYYSVQVYDKDWNTVKFATESRIIQLDYLDHKEIVIYVRDKDKQKALYICTKSKIVKGTEVPTMLASRICSKIK